jgi:SpoU rRNA methylase family enzyme
MISDEQSEDMNLAYYFGTSLLVFKDIKSGSEVFSGTLLEISYTDKKIDTQLRLSY